MAFGVKWIPVLVAAFIMCGCAPEGAAAVEDAAYSEPVLLSSRKVQPYAEAAQVKLFVTDAVDQLAEARTLSPLERTAFEQTLQLDDYDHAPEAVAACFVPHHFLRYYDDKGVQIGEFQVCFCCGSTLSAPNISAPLSKGATHQVLNVDFEALADLLKSWSIESKIGCDGL